MTITLKVISSNDKLIDIYDFNNQLVLSNFTNNEIELSHSNYLIQISNYIQDTSVIDTFNSSSNILLDAIFLFIGIIGFIVLLIALKQIKKHGLRF